MIVYFPDNVISNYCPDIATKSTDIHKLVLKCIKLGVLPAAVTASISERNESDTTRFRSQFIEVAMLVLTSRAQIE